MKHLSKTFSCIFRIIGLLGLYLLVVGPLAAQTLFAVGDPNAAGGSNPNRLLTVNPATGASANPAGCPNLSFNSRAIAVSPVDGLVYYIQETTAAPQLNSINPGNPVGTGCVNGTARATTLPANIARATFCPDGRLYAGSNTAQFFELNAATGTTVRTLNFSGLTTGGNANGNGDFACTSNGDLYILSLSTTGGANNVFSLFRALGTAVQATANNGTVSVATLGALGINALHSGLSEVDAGQAGCAAAPNPCLRTNSTTDIYAVNSLNGAATLVGAHGIGDFVFDLGRSFPTDVSIAKTGTPSVVLQGQTASYILNIANAGPGVAASVTVTDVFSSTTFAAVSWTCAPVLAGTTTLVSTACSAASGTGSINNTVSLSLGGSVRYSITALLTSIFVGTLTNVGAATVSVLITDTPTVNNISNTSTTVMPAAFLQVSKTNGLSNLVAGSTVVYTLTVANFGPADAPGTTLTDPAIAGLNCTSVSCTSTAANMCPASPSIGALQGAGLQVTPTFAMNTSASFVVTCGVTATGE